MNKLVTQVQFIAHQQSIIKKLQKDIIDNFNKVGYFQMKELKDAVIYRQRLVGFARSGKMKEFFI